MARRIHSMEAVVVIGMAVALGTTLLLSQLCVKSKLVEGMLQRSWFLPGDASFLCKGPLQSNPAPITCTSVCLSVHRLRHACFSACASCTAATQPGSAARAPLSSLGVSPRLRLHSAGGRAMKPGRKATLGPIGADELEAAT